MTTCILVHTTGGKSFARKIGRKLNAHNFSYYLSSVNDYPDVHIRHPELNQENSFIHSRAAYPYISGARWLRSLCHSEAMGYLVVNDTDCLRLTSNKLRCSLLFNKKKVSHPKTYEVTDDTCGKIYNQLPIGHYVVKPLTSMSQGKHVQKFTKMANNNLLLNAGGIIAKVPGHKKVIQHFVPAIALHRVIVLNGTALSFSFVDKIQKNWKLSVCLNKDTMEFNPHPDNALLKLAEKAQQVVDGKINFIDIFETKIGYSISEINTACNLTIHENLSKVSISDYIARTLIKIWRNR